MMRTITNLLFVFLMSSSMAWSAPTADAPSFFARYSEIAQDGMKSDNIPASIKLAQAALESGWGESELAIHANNYFGIKCRSAKECTNQTYMMKDDDLDKNGNLIKSTFMTFSNPEESFFMHTSFLKSNMKRYGSLFNLPMGDYRAWAHGLKKAGYATAPDYAEKLITLIEKHQLYKYDQQIMTNSYQHHSKVDALNQLAAIAQPSNPVNEEKIKIADDNGSFGSESIVGYTPNNITTTADNFPSAPENPRASNNTWASNQKVNYTNTLEETPANIQGQSFGSQDITNYTPESYKELLGEDTEKGVTRIQKLESMPDKKMIGGGTQPR